MAKKRYVFIRRQWNDWRIAKVEFSKLKNLHWSHYSGGVYTPCPQPFIHGYVLCTDVIGEIAHSGMHGPCPHSIKVCVIKKDNDTKIWQEILKIVGPKPKK